jgi:hypothetical protein
MSKWLTWGTSRETPDGHKINTTYGTSNRTDSATSTDFVNEEFTRFEDLTRKLANVPKPELDQQRSEDS